MREAFCTSPSFFKPFLSWLVSFDLSHPWIWASSILVVALVEVCFDSFARGGIERASRSGEEVCGHKYAAAHGGNGNGGERDGRFERRSEGDNWRRKKILYSKSNESPRRRMVKQWI
jgi:hypothetical protein